MYHTAKQTPGLSSTTLLKIGALLASCVFGCGPAREADRPIFYYHRDDNLGSSWSPSKQVLDSVGNIVLADGPRNILVIMTSVPEPMTIRISSSTKQATVSIGTLSGLKIGPTRNRMYLVCGSSGELTEFDLADSEAAAFVASRANDQDGDAIALARERAICRDGVVRLEDTLRNCANSVRGIDHNMLEEKGH